MLIASRLSLIAICDLRFTIVECRLVLRSVLRRVVLKIENRKRNHIDRALTAVKNPQLKMKLQNMPVPLTPKGDEYMAPVLEAARGGDLTLIKNAKIGT